ncbi:hypothetical protein, partial [Mycobacterium sp. E342]|uniref:hypothetical protein n=1 Tax=Mycobacterium sp. E342 TaxID=1834147 RepID=UPI001E575E4B
MLPPDDAAADRPEHAPDTARTIGTELSAGSRGDKTMLPHEDPSIGEHDGNAGPGSADSPSAAQHRPKSDVALSAQPRLPLPPWQLANASMIAPRDTGQRLREHQAA